MDKQKLRQYQALKKEIVKLNKDLDKLYARDIPVVKGKVVGSMDCFPYTEVRTTVEMDEPVESDRINLLIRLKEKRLQASENLLLEIEEYINSIQDSSTRQIFEAVYIDGVSITDVAKEVGYTKGRISQIILKTLKD